MRQGRATRDVLDGWKRDPVAGAINVKAVAQIGTSIGNHATGQSKPIPDTVRKIHEGRGFNSPLGSPGSPGVGVGRTIHKSGSQCKS